VTTDPMQRFIGVKGNSPPWELLDLPQAQSSKEQIDAALRKRITQVEAHPDGLNEEASEVRKQLRHAAMLTFGIELGPQRVYASSTKHLADQDNIPKLH